jgi:transcriptional regulator with XRE-family HTH domain
VPKPTKPKPINWVAIRAEYEAGGISLRQLADKLGVNRRTLERRCSKESWVNGVGNVSAEVDAKVSAEIREKAVSQRVKKKLTDIEMIDKIISGCFDAYIENPDTFKTTGENIAAIERMFKLKLEYSQERIEKWLYDRGYVAVPIPELASTDKDNDSEGREKGDAIPFDSVMAGVAEIKPTIIPTASRNLEDILAPKTGDRIQDA